MTMTTPTTPKAAEAARKPATPRKAATPRKPAAPRKGARAAEPVGPRFVRHPKRPDWGIGRILDVFVGLMRVRFADGTTREFRESLLEIVNETDVSAEMLTATTAPVEPPPRPRAPPKPRVRKPAAT